MERLLTTRDLQQILQVDRITIYRMLDAGELPGIKVGGQWRFPEKAVEDWLGAIKGRKAGIEESPRPPRQLAEVLASDSPVKPRRLTDLVSTVCLQNVQDGFSEAVGVASLVIDLEGMPLTSISNMCEFCRLGRGSEEFRRRCSASWASLSDVREAPPQLHVCHAGVGYAVAPVEVHDMRLGLVVAGQFWAERPEMGEREATARRLAAEGGLSVGGLLDAMDGIPVYGHERVFLVTKLLATIANSLSEIGFQAYEVRLKLQQIARIVETL